MTTPNDQIAPVQGYSAGIPWAMHLRAYDAYRKEFGEQKALITGNCRGGFGTGELDRFIPGWREELSELTDLRTQLAAAQRERDEWKVDATEWGEVAAIRQREVNGLRAEVARLTKEHEEELCRWQDRIYHLCCALAPAKNIDGGGCDSGDPLDLTTTEIQQMASAIADERDTLAATVAELQRDRERLDWLESSHNIRITKPDDCPPWIGAISASGEKIREVIDAAMRAKGGA